MPPSTRELSNRAAIVGIGETDYHLDFQAWRARVPGTVAPGLAMMVKTAFERALADSGFDRKDIDGLAVSLAYGQSDLSEMADALDLKPRYLIANGNIMAGPLPVACAAIAAGKCDTIAMVYAVASRSGGRQFGGSTYSGQGGAPASYSYYHPWGWTSQAAHWAMMCSHYHAEHGTNEEDLGTVAIQLRRNAMRDPNAVMQTPLSLDDYLAARHIVRPLRLFDLCLVNDGAVCLIVSRSELAKDLPHAPVLVSGWGESRVKADKMRALIQDRLQVQMQDATQQALTMAGLELADVGHFEGYDAASIHLASQIEGHGFVPAGTALEFCKAGEMAVDGELPVNTAGGNMSGSYMHGWSQVAEVTRQLRHEAGARQIKGLQASMSSLVQTDSGPSHSVRSRGIADVTRNRPDRVLGPRHDEFWSWCEQGELRLQRCEACRKLNWPAVQSCEHCDATSLSWERMSGRGKIVSWCTFEKDYFDRLLPLPWETILVQLDEGSLFISNPLGLDTYQIRAGLRVQVAFVSCEDSFGAFRLPVFEVDRSAA